VCMVVCGLSSKTTVLQAYSALTPPPPSLSPPQAGDKNELEHSLITLISEEINCRTVVTLMLHCCYTVGR
jgi:hypothetical protein